jgi:hypothetical protein
MIGHDDWQLSCRGRRSGLQALPRAPTYMYCSQIFVLTATVIISTTITAATNIRESLKQTEVAFQSAAVRGTAGKFSRGITFVRDSLCS